MVTAPAERYTLSLHDALPISTVISRGNSYRRRDGHSSTFHLNAARAQSPWTGTMEGTGKALWLLETRDRKSTRLNSSHRCISYAVFCVKKKNEYISSATPTWQ